MAKTNASKRSISKGKDKVLVNGGISNTFQPPFSSTINFPIAQKQFVGGDQYHRDQFSSRAVYGPIIPSFIRVWPVKLPLTLFTDHITPRLKWTQILHEYFVQTMMELGGPHKVTPTTLQKAMNIEDLTHHHVKSHLQKYRAGRITVRDWHEPQNFRIAYEAYLKGEISLRELFASPSSQEPSQEDDGSNVNKRSKKKKKVPTPADLHLKLQAAEAVLQAQKAAKTSWTQVGRENTSMRHTNDHQYRNTGVENHQNVGGTMSEQDLSGFNNQATEPATIPLHSAQQEPNNFDLHNALDRIREYLGLEKESNTDSNSNLQQPQPVVNVADNTAEIGGVSMTSNGYSFQGPENNSATTASAVNNVQVGLQQAQLQGFQNQDGVYNFQCATSHGYSIPWSESNSTTSDINNVQVGLQQQLLQDFQNQDGVCNFQCATSNGYSYPGSASHSTTSTDINNVQVGLQQPLLQGFQNQDGVCNFQCATTNGYSYPGSASHSTTITDINNVQVGHQEKISGFKNQNRVNNLHSIASNGYSFEGSGSHSTTITNTNNVQVGLREQISGFQSQNEVYKLQSTPSNELSFQGWSGSASDFNNVQVGPQEQQLTGFQNQDGANNFETGNEAQMVQPAQDDEAIWHVEPWNKYLMSLENQNGPSTYPVQHQNANLNVSSPFCETNGAQPMSNANASSSSCLANDIPMSNPNAPSSSSTATGYLDDCIAAFASVKHNPATTAEDEPWEATMNWDISELDVSDCLDFSKESEFPEQP